MTGDTADLDFAADAEVVHSFAEGHRLTYGYLYSSFFAIESSLTDPVFRQYIGVYNTCCCNPGCASCWPMSPARSWLPCCLTPGNEERALLESISNHVAARGQAGRQKRLVQT